MRTPEFTEEQQAYIDDMRNAMREEFARTEQDPHARKNTIESITDLERDALDALKHTLKHGESESIKTKVAMWVIDTKLDAAKVGDDPLEKFLAGLQEIKAVSAPTP